MIEIRKKCKKNTKSQKWKINFKSPRGLESHEYLIKHVEENKKTTKGRNMTEWKEVKEKKVVEMKIFRKKMFISEFLKIKIKHWRNKSNNKWKAKLQFKSLFRNRNKNNTKQNMNLACMKIAFESGY